LNDFEIAERTKDGHRVALTLVDGVKVPVVFTRPGTYAVDARTQKSAFAAGTVYFRHRAKSEPGNTDDLRAAIDRQLESIRKAWLKGVRKAVEAPPGSRVIIAAPVGESGDPTPPETQAIRIVDDPSAPAYRRFDYDVTHPNRQKEVLDKVNSALSGSTQINQWDIQCVRRVYEVDTNEEYCHKGKFDPSARYSEDFVEWLITQFRMDAGFFDKCREEIYLMSHPLPSAINHDEVVDASPWVRSEALVFHDIGTTIVQDGIPACLVRRMEGTAMGRAHLAPDGSYVGCKPHLAPDGSYVGGSPQLAPDGTYVGGRPQLAPDGTYVSGRPHLAPDGTYVGGRPTLAPDGTYVGDGS
jgi:hypothetical protein